MKILLTGAAGFLGSNLASHLLSLGHEVIGLDDLSTGSLTNLDEQLQHNRFKFIQADIRDALDFEVDLVANFACPASPVHYQADPVKTIETNFLGMINVLHLARQTNAKVLQASTSEVYGDPEITPQAESYWGNVNPIGIRSCYDEGKRAAETLCFDYNRQYGLDIRVIRIFNTYGPKMAIGDGRVVSNFIVQALKGEDITIYGDGTQTRSFCYVSDLIDGISQVIHSPGVQSPINLGNPEEFSMQELADTIVTLTQSKSKLIFHPLPSDDPKQRNPNIERARLELGWNPRINLKSGLMQTIEYFKKII